MITRLVLKNYKPSLTKGLKEIDLNFNHLVNIILGINGISKTSILKEANPFPAEGNNFAKDGYKLIEITDNGKHFVLESFTCKKKHSFKIDGVEYNPNGTQTVQKDLVEQHLHLTSKINKALTGLDIRDLFTSLTSAGRKELFMDLYPNDVNYSLNVYNKLKVNLRDTIGAIKNQSERLAEEQQRYKKLQEINDEELIAKIDTIDGQLKNALVLQGSLSNVTYNDGEFNTLNSKFNRLVNELVLFNFGNYTTPVSSLQYTIRKLTEIVDYKLQVTNRLEGRINELSIGLSGLSIVEQDPELFEINLKSVRNELLDLDKDVVNLRNQLKDLPVFGEFDLTNIIPYTDVFIRYLNAVVIASNDNMTNSKYKDVLLSRDQTNNSLRSISAEIDELEHTLKHFNNANEVECNKCNNKFKPGFKVENIEAIKVRVDSLNRDKTSTIVKLKNLDNQIELDADWYSSMQSLMMFIKENKTVEHLMLLVKSFDIGRDDSNILINALKMHYSEFKLKGRVVGLLDEEVVLSARLAILKRNDMVELLNEFKCAEQLLGEHNNYILNLKAKVNKAKKELDDINSYKFKLSALDKYKKDLLEMLSNRGGVDLRNKIESIVSELSPIKDGLIQDLIRSKSTVNVIINIEENIANLKKRRKHLKTLVDGLCPNKGLIGKLMSDFITKVCGNMNAIIREVWVNPLYIKPCSNGKDELNYLFPVINSFDNSTNNDIGECSGGEREIINLAFRIVMLNYINYDFPLFMDEVGGALDEVHRTRFFEYIKQFCSSGKINQMFMISHYVSQYGLLTNAGANVIQLNPSR